MLSLAAPGSSIPGPDARDAIVVGFDCVLDTEERRVIDHAGSVVWCSGALPAATAVRLAQLHRAA